MEATTLRPGEVVRMFKQGGRSRNGLYQILIALRKDGSVVVKTGKDAGEMTLPEPLFQDIIQSASTLDIAALTKNPRKERELPSASDGQDVYLTVHRGAKPWRWTNTKHDAPDSFPLLEALEKVESMYIRSRMRH